MGAKNTFKILVLKLGIKVNSEDHGVDVQLIFAAVRNNCDDKSVHNIVIVSINLTAKFCDVKSQNSAGVTDCYST